MEVALLQVAHLTELLSRVLGKVAVLAPVLPARRHGIEALPPRSQIVSQFVGESGVVDAVVGFPGVDRQVVEVLRPIPESPSEEVQRIVDELANEPGVE